MGRLGGHKMPGPAVGRFALTIPGTIPRGVGWCGADIGEDGD